MNDARNVRADVLGRVVWHDLLTGDVEAAKHFYAALLGWDYQIEHATDFAWRAGEADYPLIVANGAAHGGFVDPGDGGQARWLAYVAVADVDAVAAKAAALGAKIAKPPFDVPGVGRSAVIADRQGAMIAVHVRTHGFPPPEGTFLRDELTTDDLASAEDFYAALFGWWTGSMAGDLPRDDGVFRRADGSEAGRIVKRGFESEGSAVWMPYLATDDVDAAVARALSLGATQHRPVADTPTAEKFAVFSDPSGAMFGLLRATSMVTAGR